MKIVVEIKERFAEIIIDGKPVHIELTECGTTMSCPDGNHPDDSTLGGLLAQELHEPIGSLLKVYERHWPIEDSVWDDGNEKLGEGQMDMVYFTISR